jgi:hypothetical protein
VSPRYVVFRWEGIISAGAKEPVMVAWMIDDKSVELWWNDTDRGKPMYWDKSLSQYQFVQHKSHVYRHWVKAVSTGR